MSAVLASGAQPRLNNLDWSSKYVVWKSDFEVSTTAFKWYDALDSNHVTNVCEIVVIFILENINSTNDDTVCSMWLQHLIKKTLF